MTLFQHPAFDDREQVAFVSDRKSGLRAVIAVHRVGPRNAMGGTRMWEYATEADGIGDALRLSQAMTYKSALAGLPFGGGKAVIFGNSGRDKTPGFPLTAQGIAWFGELGLTLERKGRRPLVRSCLDWTERKPHLAGLAGAELCRHALDAGWCVRIGSERAVKVTADGERALAELLGIEPGTLR